MNRPALSCERCSSAIAVDDLRCPICNLTCPASRDEDRAHTAVEILRCSGCGAAMTYDVSKLAAACAFCGSVLEIERPADPVEEARVLLPFTVARERAEASFRDWLGSLGWFRPKDLRTGARLETIQALRWVGWVFDARATVSWAVDTDSGTQRADWAPHAGTAELDYIDVIVPATRGLTHDEVARLVTSYDLSSAAGTGGDVDPATVERFDLPRSTARARVVEAVEKLARRRLAERHFPGAQFRNLHTATVLRALEARRCAFPAWVLAYRYKGRLYRTVLSGQDENCLRGEAPYSIARITTVVAAAVAAIVGLLALMLL